MNWQDHLNRFGKRLLAEMGVDPTYGLPTGSNPVTDALAEGGFVERYGHLPKFNRGNVCRAATLCQMAVFDAEGGPEGDGKPKALRRHWYNFFKTKLAQPFAMELGDFEVNAVGVKEIKDRAWTGRLSTTYAEFVDGGEITYKDLWVEDASRMMDENWQVLFGGCNIAIAVEKDSLFGDFLAPAKALGARTVYSGKGKSSKAAIEKVLRDHYRWGSWNNPFDQNPLIILHVSDHDYDGEAVIGPTFAEQARRYTLNVFEARVGIRPENVTDLGHDPVDKWYSIKIANKGYEEWADRKALFLARCVDCGNEWVTTGTEDWLDKCPACGGERDYLEIGVDTAHGYEVEALRTRDYYGLLVDALLTVLPFDYIVGRLRDQCKASAHEAADRIADGVFEQNESYQALLAEFDRLEEIKAEFEEKVKSELVEVGESHEGDWRDDDDDPEPGQFRGHVEGASDYSEPWRPFKEGDRTRRLTEFLRDETDEQIAGFVGQVIEW